MPSKLYNAVVDQAYSHVRVTLNSFQGLCPEILNQVQNDSIPSKSFDKEEGR
jgi:hypothetical protein